MPTSAINSDGPQASAPAKHPVDEILPAGKLFIYGLQHVLAMYAGAVAVPLILAASLNLSREQLIYLIDADLLTCGLATLIQTLGFWKFGIRLLVIQGVTFAAVTPMILIGRSHGLTTIYGAVIVAGFITMIASPWFSRLLRFFPPVVTGSIITIIGVSLLPVAVRWAAGGNPAAANFGDPRFIGLALVVLLLVVTIYRLFTGFLGNIAVLLGLVGGLLIAIPLGLTEFSAVSKAPWIGITTPFAFGLPKFEISAIIAMTLVMLVVMVETTGDFIAVGEIVDRPVTQDDLTRGLRADGISTMLGGVLNAFPYTAYAQNVGLVGLTAVKSRYVVAAAGGILVVLGLCPKLAAIIASIPAPVLGGAGIVMFGMVAASGIRTLTRLNFDNNHNLMIIAVSLGVGLIPLAVPSFYHKFPESMQVFLNSGITIGSITAILMNAMLNFRSGKAPGAAA